MQSVKTNVFASVPPFEMKLRRSSVGEPLVPRTTIGKALERSIRIPFDGLTSVGCGSYALYPRS